MPNRDPRDNRPNERFHPAMPRIPGVSDRAQPPPAQPHDGLAENDVAAPPVSGWNGRLLIMAVLAAGFFGVLGWWTVHAKRAPAKASDTAAVVASDPLPDFAEDPVSAVPTQDTAAGLTTAASLAELAKPWSFKKFVFTDPQTHEPVPAMVVRLPGSNPASKDAYWAFSLNAPYKTCQLDYLENPADVASRYAYRASHPMVVAPCDGTLYDPLRVGTTPTGAWVRGDIAQGPGIRPPISIEVRVQGSRIVADRIE